jgi:hypothetical protein
MFSYTLCSPFALPVCARRTHSFEPPKLKICLIWKSLEMCIFVNAVYACNDVKPVWVPCSDRLYFRCPKYQRQFHRRPLRCECSCTNPIHQGQEWQGNYFYSTRCSTLKRAGSSIGTLRAREYTRFIETEASEGRLDRDGADKWLASEFGICSTRRSSETSPYSSDRSQGFPEIAVLSLES